MKSMNNVLISQDFEEAKTRYEACTSNRWKGKWWEIICEIYQTSAEWAKKYTLDPVSKAVYAIADAIKKIAHGERRKTIPTGENSIRWGNTDIIFCNNTQTQDDKTSNKAYFFKFYDSNNNILFNKIGTTIKACLARLKNEIRYYIDHGFDISLVKICAIWNCGTVPPEGFESHCRGVLIKQYPGTWKKNDRFFGIDIPTSVFVSLCNDYATS